MAESKEELKSLLMKVKEERLIPENDSYATYFANSKRDRLHPNTSGHRRIADLIEARLNALPATFRR